MPYILLSLAAIFWGGNYVVGHILVQYIDPYFLSLIRWGATTLLITVLYWKTLRNDLPVLCKNIRINILLSFLGQVSFPLTLYIGLQYTSSLNAAIYISSTPCMVLIINHFLFKDRVSLRNILGVISSTAGVVYMAICSARGINKFALFGWGDILTIISALSWAFYCALLRLKEKNVSNTSFVAFCSLIGTMILIPVYLLHRFFSHGYQTMIYSVNTVSVLGTVFLIIFPSWLSYVFWSKGVSLIGTTRSEIYTHLIPLSGGLMGIVFLNNKPEFYHLVTLILIVFGIVRCSVQRQKV